MTRAFRTRLHGLLPASIAARLVTMRFTAWGLLEKDNPMTDTPDKKTAVVNTAKVAGIVTLLPSLFSTLPQNVALIICATMVTCAAITASVPAPTSNRLLIALYQAVRVVGLGIKYALPYVATHLVKAAPAAPAAPLAGPGSVITIPRDTAK
jgi:hypothetical protein